MRTGVLRAVLGVVVGFMAVVGPAQGGMAAETHTNCIIFDASGNMIGLTPNCTQTMVQAGGDPQSMPVHNPCTGDAGILTQTPNRQVFHITVNGASDAWDTGTMNGTATFAPTDPSAPSGSGKFATWFGDEFNAQNTVQHFTSNIELHLSNGQTVKAHIQAQFTMTPSGAVVVNNMVKDIACV